MAIDSTIGFEVIDAGEGASGCAIGSLEGGSSSISETSSREVVDMRRWSRGDFADEVLGSFREPFSVVAGVIDCWLWRLFVVLGDEIEAVSEAWASCWER